MFGSSLLETCSFLMTDGKGVNLEGRGGREELGKIQKKKTEIRIYCTRKKILAIKEKINKKL